MKQNMVGFLFFSNNRYITAQKLDIFLANQLERFGVISDQGNIKKFVRAYYEITKNFTRTKYIPKFDRYTAMQKDKY